MYEGYWNEDKRDGLGVFYKNNNENQEDATYGFWEEDELVKDLPYTEYLADMKKISDQKHTCRSEKYIQLIYGIDDENMRQMMFNQCHQVATEKYLNKKDIKEIIFQK